MAQQFIKRLDDEKLFPSTSGEGPRVRDKPVLFCSLPWGSISEMSRSKWDKMGRLYFRPVFHAAVPGTYNDDHSQRPVSMSFWHLQFPSSFGIRYSSFRKTACSLIN
jgi:hypothetical protein